jgi:hypothetical protein
MLRFIFAFLGDRINNHSPEGDRTYQWESQTFSTLLQLDFGIDGHTDFGESIGIIDR